jgi:hypothetical protein
MADVVSGTYDFVGEVVRRVRDANLSLRQVNEIRRAAQQARKGDQTAEEFVQANPAVAPVVKLIAQQAPGRDWLMILLMVLAIVIPYLQNAAYHADDQRQQATRPPQTTTALSDRQVARIEQQVIARLQTASGESSARANRPQGGKPARRNREPKQYGQNKRKRRR